MAKSTKTTTEERIKNLEGSIGRIEAMLRQTPEPNEKRVIENTGLAAPQPPAPDSTGTDYPVPTAYANVVYSALNTEFGISMTPMTDAPAFQFNIVVPDKYSSLTPEKKKMLGADIRSKVISYAEGVNGVREWSELVKGSFTPDVQAQIHANANKTT